MAQTKWTQGLWKVTLGGVCLPENQRIIHSVLGKENGIMNVRTICRTFDYGTVDESLANADLIASAPDMFKALKAVEVSLIEDEYYQHFKPLLKTVREALNKAEGVK